MTKKIVFVHNTMQYLRMHYIELISSFQRHSWSVICVAPMDPAAEALRAAGVECIDLPLTRRGLNPLREVVTVTRLASILRAKKPDAVLNFSIKPTIYGSLAARLAKVSRTCSMITGLGYVFIASNRKLQKILAVVVKFAYRTTLKTNHAVFFQNPDDRDFFLENRVLSQKQCVVLAGSGIDTQKFVPTEGTAERDCVRFILIGRLIADKGIREYVAAAKDMQSDKARFSLLGPFDDNPSSIDEREVRSWEQEGIVDYLGETDDVCSVIAEHDVFVLPSYREGLPRATLEAMSMSKPVVTTDVPGCRETVVEGVNGYLVPAKNATELKNAMRRFTIDRTLVEKMGSESRALAVAKFDVRKVNDTIIQMIAQP